MPSRFRVKICEQCGKQWETRSETARTCSPKCRAQLREKEHGKTEGRKPRDYPEELVEEVRTLYEAGHTIREIQERISGAKVQNIIARYGIKTRSTAKRNQWGINNSSWRGDQAGYCALHLRVQQARGKPSSCEICGASEPARYEWANLTGNYLDINDYSRMCIPCHRSFDAERRRKTGMRTSPVRR